MDEFASRRYPIHEHMRFQRRAWLVERIGWGLLTALALAGLAGLFGTGWLSKNTLNGGALSVEYERFERRTRIAAWHFHFPPGESERSLHLNRTFQKNFEVTGVQPQALRSEADGNGLRMTFAVPASGGTVTMWLHPRDYGIFNIEARAGDGAPLSFSVLVYP